jgi:hypothetical protein
MVKKKFMILLLVISFFLITPVNLVFGEATLQKTPDFLTVFKLLEKQAELDGTEITFHGELIGQPIFEKMGVFVNIMDVEFNALGIYLPKKDLIKFNHYGRHGQKGDYIQVSGTFHKVCSQHGGDTDLHAKDITVITPGETIPEPTIPPYKIILGTTLILIVLYLFFSSRQLGAKKEKL